MSEYLRDEEPKTIGRECDVCGEEVGDGEGSHYTYADGESVDVCEDCIDAEGVVPHDHIGASSLC